MRFSFGLQHASGLRPEGSPLAAASPASPSGLALGLHPRGSGTTVLPVSTCHLQHPDADRILQVCPTGGPCNVSCHLVPGYVLQFSLLDEGKKQEVPTYQACYSASTVGKPVA